MSETPRDVFILALKDSIFHSADRINERIRVEWLARFDAAAEHAQATEHLWYADAEHSWVDVSTLDEDAAGLVVEVCSRCSASRRRHRPPCVDTPSTSAV